MHTRREYSSTAHTAAAVSIVSFIGPIFIDPTLLLEYRIDLSVLLLNSRTQYGSSSNCAIAHLKVGR